MNTGRRSRARRPTIEAVIAARISTPSRPSRKTMIAELVTTVASFAESPSVAAASASLRSSTSRVSRISRRGARWAICLARPSLPAPPNQIRPSMSSASPWSNERSRRSGPNSKNPYASSRACSAWRYWPAPAAPPPPGPNPEEPDRPQPRLLGLAVLAGAGRRLHAVERERDQVVVGLVGLLRPRLRHRGLQLVLHTRGQRLDLLVSGDAVLALLRVLDQAAELVQVRCRRVGARPVALGELVAQVAQGGDR